MILPVSDKAVLRLIQSRRASSQVQIARQLGVSANTIHSIIRRLLDQQAIERSNTERRQIGRPTLHYRMKIPAPSLAVQWMGTEWHLGLIYPDEALDTAIHWEMAVTPDAKTALKVLAQNAVELLKTHKLSIKKVAGCAFSLNAARVKKTGQLTSSVIPWAAEIRESDIEEALGCRAWLLTAPGSAETELSERAPVGCRRLSVFNVGDGVSGHGCGYTPNWSDTEILHGEIGHIIAEPGGKACGCGHRGCLETVLSGPALQQRVREDIKSGIQTKLSRVLEDPPKAFFNALEAWAVSGRDDYASSIADEFLDRCAWAVSIIANIYNPDVIVLSGYGLDGRTRWMSRIRELALPKVLHGEQLTLEFPRCAPSENLRRLAEAAFLNQ